MTILHNYFKVTVGTRISDSISFLQRKGYIYRGTSIFVKHVYFLSNSLFLILIYSYILTHI
nr:MAG TPA: hypothetical protein [Caudoviricetes sp.]